MHGRGTGHYLPTDLHAMERPRDARAPSGWSYLSAQQGHQGRRLVRVPKTTAGRPSQAADSNGIEKAGCAVSKTHVFGTADHSVQVVS